MKPKQNILDSEGLSFTKEARFLTGQHLPKSLSDSNATRQFIPHSASKWAWLIETGVVKTYTWNEEGNQIILGYWGMGDLIGQPLSIGDKLRK
jgi:CRP-like cAMP-binding protein